MSDYTFGTGEPARERLRKISEFFNRYSEHFVLDNILDEPNVVFDLGCGPGFTSEMLKKAFPDANVVGFDSSDAMIADASGSIDNIQFKQADVTGKLSDKADLIYCRFLLSHIDRGLLEKVIATWYDALNEDGAIFIDELEEIQSQNSIFRQYLDINEQLLNSQNADLYVGSKLEGLDGKFVVRKDYNELIQVKDADAASWFYPNTQTVWENENFVQENTTQKQRETIAEGLKKIIESDSDACNIIWVMKRMIIQKV